MARDAVQVFRELWSAGYGRARRPVTGVLLDEATASEVLERVLTVVLDDYETLPGKAELAAEVMRRVREGALTRVAAERRSKADEEVFRDVERKVYERNPCLVKLQRRDGEGRFNDREWDGVPTILKPLAMSVLGKKGLGNEDSEDVFSEAMAGLVKARESDGVAPIERVTVFEEVAPVFTAILGHRMLDWVRKQKAQKNQANTGASLEALGEERGYTVDVADPKSAGIAGETWIGDWSFDVIYHECRSELSDFEWRVIYEIYVSGEMTRGELIEDAEMMGAMGVNSGDSTAKRRRVLNSHLESGLAKLSRLLQD